MILHLKIVGLLSVLLALVHVIFPRYFKWEQELPALSLINRQLMYVHTFFLALVLLLTGLLLLFAADDIRSTGLGRKLALGLFLFWGVRLAFQFFVYSPKLWRGKPFETLVHVGFAGLWTYFTGVFFWVYRNGTL
jgi:hypothetical protein